jgi:hypothetical protein
MKAEGQNNPFLYIISRFLFTVERQSFRNAIFSPSTFQNIIKAQMLSRDTAVNLRHVAFSMLEKIFAISKQGPPALRLYPEAQPFYSQSRKALSSPPKKNLHLKMF